MDSITQKNVQEFISMTRSTADVNNFTVQFVDAPHVQYPGSTIAVDGYILEFPKKMFVVATGKPMLEWLKVMVQQAGHLDQCFDASPLWQKRLIPGIQKEVFQALLEWVEGKIEYRETVLEDYIHRVRNMRVDSELRAIAKIKAWKLPIDVDEYIQQANASLYFYRVMILYRKWYRAGCAPRNMPAVWSLMPKHFNNDYDVLPESFVALYRDLI